MEIIGLGGEYTSVYACLNAVLYLFSAPSDIFNILSVRVIDVSSVHSGNFTKYKVLFSKQLPFLAVFKKKNLEKRYLVPLYVYRISATDYSEGHKCYSYLLRVLVF